MLLPMLLVGSSNKSLRLLPNRLKLAYDVVDDHHDHDGDGGGGLCFSPTPRHGFFFLVCLFYYIYMWVLLDALTLAHTFPRVMRLWEIYISVREGTHGLVKLVG